MNIPHPRLCRDLRLCRGPHLHHGPHRRRGPYHHHHRGVSFHGPTLTVIHGSKG